MLRLIIATGLLLVAALLQSELGQRLPLLGGRPDLPLVLVVAWGMLRGPNEGAVVGFIGGMLLDSVSYTQFGLHASLLGIVGFCTGQGETNLYRGNLPFFLATAGLATLLYHTAQYLVLQAMGTTLPPVTQTVELALPASLANAALLVPVFLICRRLLRALDGWRQLQL